MRIDYIEIINYRQYINVRYEFGKKKGYDLHIIKGKNGMGKTNLLNAITWCLYNEEPHLGKENSGKPRLNTLVLNKAKADGIEKCEIIVRVALSENSNSIVFERKQEYGTNGHGFEYKPSFSVSCIQGQGEANVFTDDETANNYVNRYLPYGIRNYFFFDGEQLEKYVLNEQGEEIKQAIHVISQVKLLTSMKDRLEKVVNELNSEAGKKNKNINVEVKQKNDLKNKTENMEDTIKELKKQIIVSESVIKECNDFLKGKDGVPEKEKEFEDLQEDLANKIAEKEEVDAEIRKFIIRYKTLFSFYPAIKDVYDKICKKEIEGAFPPSIDKDYLKRMLKEHKCFVCDRDLGQHDEKSVKNLLEKLSLSSEPIQILTKIKGELEDRIDETKDYIVKRDKLFGRSKSIEVQIEKIEEKLNKLDSYLKRFSNKEKIRNMHQKRIDNTNLVKVNRTRLVTLEVQFGEMKKELKNIENKIKDDMEAINEFNDLNRKIDFAMRSKGIITAIETEMMDEVREKMRCEIMKLFEELEWKKESFSHIELDEMYNLELFDNDEFPSIGTCSAGERALLALSFTLALQKVSGYDSMLFIDTPVGRIDEDNRANFAQVLKNVSMNKQIIITFTNSEYSKEIQNVFEPIRSSFVELVTKDEKVTTLNVEE
ncbi:hypothetical protein [Clostridium sp. AWRP]|uniref:hypothetical protein n=1 Tax=Clostridium sp. AWRP TaxID=2212991 RepID=UPI000FD8617E|nr:hypothetical protein [Clostridium sp. AWRP]AZV56429.1 hypothetical protein DMR38_07305 [Clostridium sp. AWRP]